MTRFIIRVSILFLVYVGVILGINQYLFYKTHQKMYQSKEVDTLIVGSSTFVDINEYYIDKSFNISQPASINKVIYYKLKEVHKHNKIKHVVIPLDEIQISVVSDFYLKGKQLSYETVKRMYPITSPFQLFADNTRIRTVLQIMYKYLLSINMDYFSSDEGIEKIPFHNYKSVFNKQIDYPTETPKRMVNKEKYDATLDQAIQWHYYPGNEAIVSDISIKYMDKIVDFCAAENIQLVLVSMPINAAYKARIPEIYTKSYKELVAKYEQKENVTYLNLKDYFKDKENTAHFFDLTHVSPYGGTLISKEIAAVLK